MKKIVIILLMVGIINCGKTPSILDVKFDNGDKGEILENGIIHSFENTLNPDDLNGETGKGTGNNDSITTVITASEFYNGLQSLKVTIQHLKEKEGFVYMYFNFGPLVEIDKNGDEAPQKRDVSAFNYIAFYINVIQDWTKFYIELGDITTPLGVSIKVPVTIIRKPERWQLVKVALEKFKGLDLTRVTKFLISMNKDIETQDDVEFYIDDIGFVK